jgi:hypothetical protein
MAHAALIDDRLQIDGFDAYTWSGSFGLPTDGFPKTIFIDGEYTSAIDEKPTVYTDSLSGESDQLLDTAGNMYLKTAAPSVAPFRGFPARKMEFDDGTVTWWRPGMPWSWQADGNKSIFKIARDNWLLILLVILVIIFFWTSKTKLF